MTTELMVDDMNASFNFYTKFLGFSCIVSVPEQQPFFVILQNGPVELMLYERKQFSEEIPQFKTMPVGGSIALYLTVENIDELYNDLKDKVTIIQQLHATDYATTEFSCEDNSGYVLMFNQRD